MTQNRAETSGKQAGDWQAHVARLETGHTVPGRPAHSREGHAPAVAAHAVLRQGAVAVAGAVAGIRLLVGVTKTGVLYAPCAGGRRPAIGYPITKRIHQLWHAAFFL